MAPTPPLISRVVPHRYEGFAVWRMPGDGLPNATQMMLAPLQVQRPGFIHGSDFMAHSVALPTLPLVRTLVSILWSIPIFDLCRLVV
jgi:hypothetical protein